MRIYMMLALLAISVPVLAASAPEMTEKSTAAPKIPTAVTKTLEYVQRLVKKDAEKASVTPAPVAGLYEAEVGSMVFYISADGNQFMIGTIYEPGIIDKIPPKNITEQKRNKLRADVIDAQSDSETVVFAPDTDTKYTVNVFTDVDCGYCAKFHQQVPELNKKGVKVRYLAFPRAGVGSPTYNKMVSVWCAEDQQKAMTDAKAGLEIKEAKCNNPIANQLNLGQSIGINGTPAMILSDGELVPGYMEAPRLLLKLQQTSKKTGK